jgi:hypothetical protein
MGTPLGSADESGPVNCEHDVQPVNADIVDKHII